MRVVLIGLFFLVLLSNRILSQPVVIWNKSYGGSVSDYAMASIKCSDGNILLIGTHESTDGDIGSPISPATAGDIWLIKIDSLGTILWEKSYGGIFDEYGFAICETFDHGFIIGGESYHDDGQVTGSLWAGDYWIIKVDSVGNFNWAKCLGSLGSDLISEIHQTRDSGIIVGGTIQGDGGNVTTWFGSNDFWIIKLRANGTLIWQRTIGGVGGDFCKSIKELDDGSFLVSGSVAINSNFPGNHGSDDCAVFKLDASGNLLWQKCYGGSSSDYGSLLLPDANNSFYLAGSTISNDGDVSGNHGITDFWITHCDSSGNIDWSKCYGTVGIDELYDAKITSDNGIIAVGSTDNCSGEDFYVVKIDSSQNLEWNVCLGGSNNEEAHSVLEVSPGKYLITGITNSNDGDVSFNHDSTSATNDIWTVMLSDSPLNTSQIQSPFLENLAISQSLNSLKVEFSSQNADKLLIGIYDVLGHVICQLNLNTTVGTNVINIPFNKMSGSYFMRIIDGSKSQSKMFYWE